LFGVSSGGSPLGIAARPDESALSHGDFGWVTAWAVQPRERSRGGVGNDTPPARGCQGPGVGYRVRRRSRIRSAVSRTSEAPAAAAAPAIAVPDVQVLAA